MYEAEIQCPFRRTVVHVCRYPRMPIHGGVSFRVTCPISHVIISQKRLFYMKLLRSTYTQPSSLCRNSAVSARGSPSLRVKSLLVLCHVARSRERHRLGTMPGQHPCTPIWFIMCPNAAPGQGQGYKARREVDLPIQPCYIELHASQAVGCETLI